jgi:hypothetical protein
LTQHFTRSTVSAEFYCSKCGKPTQHRIDGVKKGPCLECIAKLEHEHITASKPIPAAQRSLWGEVF